MGQKSALTDKEVIEIAIMLRKRMNILQIAKK